MGKIAIVTLNGYFNYGNRLQNYAAQEVLKSLGFSVETIIVETKPSIKKDKENNIIERLLNSGGPTAVLKKANNKLWHILNRNKIKNYNEIRTDRFKEFTTDYILETNYSIAENKIPSNLSDEYDYFVVGSDQVWNPSYINGSSIYFLTFCSKEKRIAFSPSFGVSEIPPNYIEQYRDWLSGMYNISVREDAGAKIIKKLTGRDVPVLVDPTLMLTKEAWLSIASVSKTKPQGKYLLTYFLGSIENEYRKKINKIAKANSLEIVNLANIKDGNAYKTGPSEFIDYINSASVFCTDSFHGAVFSILMETPFIVFDRKSNSPSMFSRIDTLLNKFDLSSRKVENITSNNQIFNIDFTHVPQILNIERNNTSLYLKEALGLELKKM